MWTSLKLAFQTFKKKWTDYLAVSFIFGVVSFIGILIGTAIFKDKFIGPVPVGLCITFLLIAIPMVVGLKFCAFQSYDKNQVEIKSLKIGFITFFKSIKVYLLVILKGLIIALIVYSFIDSLFTVFAIDAVGDKLPGAFENLLNISTSEYTYQQMLEIEESKRILDLGKIIGCVVAFAIVFVTKLKRDFIPFIAFEMPITSARAIAVNEKVLKGKFVRFLLNNVLILLMLLVPGAITGLVYLAMKSNEVLSPNTVMLICSVVMCILSSPIIVFQQIHYIHAYRELSKPYKEDFDNELKNVLKEIEEIQKMLNKNDEK